MDNEGSVDEVWTIGLGWIAIGLVGLGMNCWFGFVRDVRSSKSLLLIWSFSVLDELSSSDETIKSSSDEADRDMVELSWSDSMRIGSNVSLLVFDGI